MITLTAASDSLHPSRVPIALISLPSPVVRPQLLICLFLSSNGLAQALEQGLGGDRYAIVTPDSESAFFQFIEQDKQSLDCLILQETPQLADLVSWLHQQATLLPAVILQADDQTLAMTAIEEGQADHSSYLYHSAEVRASAAQLGDMEKFIDQAITEFLNLSPACLIPSPSIKPDVITDLTTQNFLMLQQQRLTQKLKERLGYLGVYYKRNPRNFFRHLSLEEQQQFLEQLRIDYREIILRYFLDDSTLNQKIDDFVNMTFFADISVAQIVEIHMHLMDEFSKQLKLEGRSEEVLLDYRLTLIDTIAHLCEMYRRSIPRQA